MARLTFLPLDLTGQSLVNRRTGEQHPLIKVGNKVNRVCVLGHGAFYTQGLIVRDNTGRLLSPVTDFKTTYHYEQLTKLTAKEVMGLIVVTNPAVVSPLTVQYQAVGGNFAVSVPELKALLDSIKEDNFDLKWEDIIGKPTAYVPEDHEHEYWQLWGMETTVTEIDRIGAAWKAGSTAIAKESKDYGVIYVQKGRDAIDAYALKVSIHLTDINNPHLTDKTKAGLGYINNWTMASPLQVVDRNDATHYMPIGGMYRILNTGPLPDLSAHVSNYLNPHGTTAAMVGSWTKTEIDSAFAGKYLWTDVANNASLYGGRAQSTLRYDVTTNLDPRDITFGGFPHTQIGYGGGGIGSDTWNWALCGDGVWRRWSDLVAPFNNSRRRYVSLGNYSTPAALQNIANVVYAGWPDNTIAIGTYYNFPTEDVEFTLLKAFIKSNGSWIPVWG
jgi:hypothetical protein